MKNYNVFISHSWNYGEAYDKLSIFLNGAPYFNYKDYSVPKDNPINNAPRDYELLEAIKNKIRPCNVVIIMAWVYSTYSKWINKEIKIAKEMGKPILAIEPWWSERTSAIVKDNADKIVWWNWSSIVSAIKEISI